MTKKFPFAKSTLTDPLEASLEVGEALSNFPIKSGFGIVYVTSFFAENLNVILETLKEKNRHKRMEWWSWTWNNCQRARSFRSASHRCYDY